MVSLLPSTQRNCEPSRYRCTLASLVLRELRFYPPNGPAVTTYLGQGYSISRLDAPERTVVTYVPLKWPEYLHVADLPFSGLL
jgi:hypothetical protein